MAGTVAIRSLIDADSMFPPLRGPVRSSRYRRSAGGDTGIDPTLSHAGVTALFDHEVPTARQTDLDTKQPNIRHRVERLLDERAPDDLALVREPLAEGECNLTQRIGSTHRTHDPSGNAERARRTRELETGITHVFSDDGSGSEGAQRSPPE